MAQPCAACSRASLGLSVSLRSSTRALELSQSLSPLEHARVRSLSSMHACARDKRGVAARNEGVEASACACT